MNRLDIQSLSLKARGDGARLFGVCELMFKISMVGVWVIAILGIILTIVFFGNREFGWGIASLITFFVVCYILYAVAVLSTHVGKVLVHTSLASVAIVEHLSENSSILNLNGCRFISEKDLYKDKGKSSQTHEHQSEPGSEELVETEINPEKLNFDMRRMEAMKRITSSGNAVSTIGEYPEMRWEIKFKNGITKRVSSLDELIRLSFEA